MNFSDESLSEEELVNYARAHPDAVNQIFSARPNLSQNAVFQLNQIRGVPPVAPQGIPPVAPQGVPPVAPQGVPPVASQARLLQRTSLSDPGSVFSGSKKNKGPSFMRKFGPLFLVLIVVVILAVWGWIFFAGNSESAQKSDSPVVSDTDTSQATPRENASVSASPSVPVPPVDMPPSSKYVVAGGFSRWCVSEGKGVHCAGNESDGKTDALAGNSISAIAVSKDASCAISEGDVWCWGRNGKGELGEGKTDKDTHDAKKLSLGIKPKFLVAGNDFFCAADSKELWCWGWEQYDELGEGQKNSAVPAHKIRDDLGVINNVFSSGYDIAVSSSKGLTHIGNTSYGQNVSVEGKK